MLSPSIIVNYHCILTSSVMILLLLSPSCLHPMHCGPSHPYIPGYILIMYNIYIYVYTLPWGSVWSIPPKLTKFTPSHCPKMAIIRKKAMISWYLFGDRQMALFAITKPPMYGWDDFVSPKGQGLWGIIALDLPRYTVIPSYTWWLIPRIVSGL